MSPDARLENRGLMSAYAAFFIFPISRQLAAHFLQMSAHFFIGSLFILAQDSAHASQITAQASQV